MSVGEKLSVTPGRRFRLATIPTDATPGIKDKAAAARELPRMLAELVKLQYRLYAADRRAVLVVLQGMDAGGKDGVVRHVFAGLNPQGCRVTSFKAPSAEELDHDFLWRVHRAVPPYGEIGVFNRSHYEDVLVVRVRKLTDEATWRARYAMINAFEEHLTRNGVVILKFFLHISAAEQTERLLARIDDPDRNWKLTPADLSERRLWPAYQEAYEEVLRRCSTPQAPWYVIPADRKWYRNWAVARVLLETLRDMKLAFPPPHPDRDALRRQVRASARALARAAGSTAGK